MDAVPPERMDAAPAAHARAQGGAVRRRRCSARALRRAGRPCVTRSCPVTSAPSAQVYFVFVFVFVFLHAGISVPLVPTWMELVRNCA
jgi:hypothetical protein